MFKIRQLVNPASDQEELMLGQVLRIYEAAFNYYPEYANKIASYLRQGTSAEFELLLLVALGAKNRVLSFSLTLYFPALKYAYLDYIASDPSRQKHGYGAALYEATREILQHMKYKGLFMDVPVDDPDLLVEKKRLKTNQRRLAFYEQLNARPIINEAYSSIWNKSNQGYFCYLLFDNLQPDTTLSKSACAKVMRRILSLKGDMNENDDKLKKIIRGLKDDPVKLREPLYQQQSIKLVPTKKDFLLDVVNAGDAHQIHHLKEKGYVERPARIKALLTGLKPIPHQLHALQPQPEKYILAVHDRRMVNFLKKGETELKPNQVLYPAVFPIRNSQRIPRSWESCAGYFCIDAFTPVTSNCFKAATNAANAAIQGAKLLLKGSDYCYVACRPPGHHAERHVFGGFCYFNNAAIAAEYLSHYGKVAILDLDYHHGNGTQQIFYQRADVLFISIHGHPCQAYPFFSGFEDEKGHGDGTGFNRNFALYPTVDDNKYLAVLKQAVKLVEKFDADYLIVSLGLDIMRGDPTGTFDITQKGMQKIGSLVGTVKKPILVIQEGGYSIQNLRRGISAFFNGLGR